MKNENITTLDNILFDKTNKLYEFNNSTECISSDEANFNDKIKKRSNKLTWSYKKDKKILQSVDSVCPHCDSSNTIKHGITHRTLRFFNETIKRLCIQRYKCNHCGKTFQTDLSSIVDKNANITNELKETINVLFQECRVKLRPICNSIAHLGKSKFCHQTVQNIAEDNTVDFKIDPYLVSGYLDFDVQWIRPESGWSYRFVLFDTVNNIPIAEKIYSEETNETVTEFLTESLKNITVKCICTDLDTKYKPIIEKLGYNHQYCLFHTKMNINKKLKLKSKENKDNKEYQKTHKKLKKELYSILDNSNYKQSWDQLNKLAKHLEGYNKEISKFITETLQPFFKSFKRWTDDNKIDKTTNKIENQSHITYNSDKRK